MRDGTRCLLFVYCCLVGDGGVWDGAFTKWRPPTQQHRDLITGEEGGREGQRGREKGREGGREGEGS